MVSLLANFESSQQAEEEPKDWRKAQSFTLTLNKEGQLDYGNHTSGNLVSHLPRILDQNLGDCELPDTMVMVTRIRGIRYTPWERAGRFGQVHRFT